MNGEPLRTAGPPAWKINDVTEEEDMVMSAILAARKARTGRRATKAAVIRDGVLAIWEQEVNSRGIEH